MFQRRSRPVFERRIASDFGSTWIKMNFLVTSAAISRCGNASHLYCTAPSYDARAFPMLNIRICSECLSTHDEFSKLSRNFDIVQLLEPEFTAEHRSNTVLTPVRCWCWTCSNTGSVPSVGHEWLCANHPVCSNVGSRTLIVQHELGIVRRRQRAQPDRMWKSAGMRTHGPPVVR